MKSNSAKVMIRYLLVIITVVLIILILNYSAFLLIARNSPGVKEPEKTVRLIAEEFKKHGDRLSGKTMEMLRERGLWVQLISKNGLEIYEYCKPDDIGSDYSLIDIAQMSRSYLNEYPVFVWKSGENLAILGYPKNSVTRYNISVPTNTFNSTPLTLVCILFLNIIITILLSLLISRRLTKPVNNIINGISMLKHEQEVSLTEKGIFKDVAQSINTASRMIKEKSLEIKRRDAAVSNWVAGISHDIRTPLSMILGYSALIEEDTELPEDIRNQSKIITENALRLRELVTNLNLATTLQYKLFPLALVPIKLGCIARKAVADCINSGILGKSSIQLVIDDENESAMLDEQLFLRVVTNLVTNSAKHNPDGCNITVNIPRNDGVSFASLIISDDGKGIPEEKIQSINRYDYHNAWGTKSQGLGLIIVKSIVEAHCGSLLIESNAGKGTAVIIRIPKLRITTECIKTDIDTGFCSNVDTNDLV